MKSTQKKSSDHSAPSRPEANPVVFNTVVREGDMITFDPTGEQLKITKIDGETITIEKLP